ncbi:hypothetical protein [Sorangium sp. So ce1182]|uniref:hypothetical protein n=1 Tax=Sorangium sp. So ce1182 TaxID=3133334 RepID=UPI003F5D8D58
MSGKALRPARIPADRRPSRGDAAIGRPWFGPPRLGERPWILTFVGTDESFVDVFFRGIRGAGAGFKDGAFPRIFPVRDYAEPPRALFDGSGAPMYRRELVEPAAGEWPGAGEAELDGTASFAAVLRDAVGESEPDPLPPAGDASGASWLRKLYLPMHVHFHVVACDLICARPGMPRIDPKRVIEAGMVVRRFIPERGGERARWEDWIPSPLGNGIWAEIADEEMKVLGEGGAAGPGVVDPGALVFGRDEVAIRDRLGLGSNPTAKLSLATVPLAAVPVGVGEGSKHTARWGFLPVSSSEKERELPDSEDAAVTIAGVLAKRASDHLEERLVSRAADIRARIRGALLALLARFPLPSRPSDDDVEDARAEITSLGLPEPIDTLAKTLGMAALSRYADRIFKHVEPPSTPWSAASQLALTGDPQDLPEGFAATFNRAPTAFSTVALSAVWSELDKTMSADSLDWSVDERLVVALLLWIRRNRVEALNRFYGSIFRDPAVPPNPDEVLTVDPDLGKRLLPMSAGPLGAELQAWLAANNARQEEPVPWPAPSSPENANDIDIHELAMTLERALADVDAQGAGAGGGYAAIADEAAHERLAHLNKLLGAPTLRERGIDLFAQPDRGLLVFPGPSPTQSSLGEWRDRVQAYYPRQLDPKPEHPGDSPEKLRSENKALRRVVRPRYDTNSLYAVWCYARVASKDRCEEPQIAWSRRTDVFSLAEPMDLLGLKPVAMRLPDLPKMMRDIPRMKKARALPFAAVTTPQDSGIKTGEDPKDTAREWGIAWICSFGIPVFTICAWVIFSIILSILLLIPGFAWLLLLKFCIPVPTSKRA